MIILALWLLWIVFNGRITVEIAAFGLFFAVGLHFFIRKHVVTGFTPAMERALLKRVPSLLQYVRFLLAEILSANLQTMRFILSDREEVVPRLVTFRSRLQTEAARVALADSITLTPGTITVLLEGDRYTVHCLDETFSTGLEDSGFEQRLLKLEDSLKTAGAARGRQA